MMDRCEELLGEVDAGRCGLTQLTREVARLRLAFESHNAFEENLLQPQLLESHLAEHRTIQQRLVGDTSGLREAIEILRAHLEAEQGQLHGPPEFT